MALYYGSGETAEAYRLLATLFLDEPDLETIEHFQDVFGVDVADSRDEIIDDYHRLFLDAESRLAPYESAYDLSGDLPVSAGKGSAGVYGAYLREGLVLEDPNIIPDHVGAELFFISYLVEAGLEDALSRFFKAHAIPWIPRFCDDLYESAFTEFYRELAAATKDLILQAHEKISGE